MRYPWVRINDLALEAHYPANTLSKRMPLRKNRGKTLGIVPVGRFLPSNLVPSLLRNLLHCLQMVTSGGIFMSRRNERFTFLLTVQEREQIAKLAIRLQRSQSDAVRWVALEAARGSKQSGRRLPRRRPARPSSKRARRRERVAGVRSNGCRRQGHPLIAGWQSAERHHAGRLRGVV